MRGVRVAIVLLSCALACAKEAPRKESAVPDAATATPPAEATAAPTQAGPAGRDFADDDAEARSVEDEAVATTPPATLEEMTASLDVLEAELRGQGVRLQTYRKTTTSKGKKAEEHPRRTPSTRPTTDTAGPVKDDDPCPRICTIATTVCELRSRICLLAEEHTDEPRYAAACKRAERDCTRATEACSGCE